MLKGTSIEAGYYILLNKRILPRLLQWNLKPDHLTYAGLATSLLAGISFVFSPVAGGALTLITGLLDTLDGTLARATGQSKKFGAFLDSVLDRYTELIIFLGIGFYFYRQDGGRGSFIWLLLLLILFGSLMVSYTRARAEGLGEGCLVGFFQRGERIIFVGLAGIFDPLVNCYANLTGSHWAKDFPLLAVLAILAVGTNFTAMWRFLHVLNKLRKR